MFLLQQMWPAVAVSAAVSALLGTLALAFPQTRARHLLTALAIAAGYACGHLCITGWPSFPPPDTVNWLPFFALLTTAVAAALSFIPSKSAQILVIGLASTTALRLLLQPKFRHTWSASEGWLWTITLAALVIMLACALTASNRRPSFRAEPSAHLLIACTGTAGALMLSGSLLLGQFALVLAASLAGPLILSTRQPPASGPTACTFPLLLIVLLASGHSFAELPIPSTLLLATAPAIILLPIPSHGSPTRLSLTTITVALALLLAWRASPPLLY